MRTAGSGPAPKSDKKNLEIACIEKKKKITQVVGGAPHTERPVRPSATTVRKYVRLFTVHRSCPGRHVTGSGTRYWFEGRRRRLDGVRSCDRPRLHYFYFFINGRCRRPPSFAAAADKESRSCGLVVLGPSEGWV